MLPAGLKSGFPLLKQGAPTCPNSEITFALPPERCGLTGDR